MKIKHLGYLFLAIAIFFFYRGIVHVVFSKPKPHPGEVWWVSKPFIGDVTIDSINREGNICFHDNDILQRSGICAPQYFEGGKHGYLGPNVDTIGGFVNPMTTKGILDSGIIVIDSGVNDTNMTGTLDSEADLIRPAKADFVRAGRVLNRAWKLYTKKQLDSAYTKGLKEGIRRGSAAACAGGINDGLYEDDIIRGTEIKGLDPICDSSIIDSAL